MRRLWKMGNDRLRRVLAKNVLQMYFVRHKRLQTESGGGEVINAKPKIEIDPEIWRMYPHAYAERLSKFSDERWIAYDYLKIVSRRISQMVAEGGGKLIVEMPPRHGKSTLISHWTPVWFLDLFPTKKVMLATYQAGFAAKWGRSVRNEIMNNPKVRVEVAHDSKSQSRWDTTKGGGMVTAGIGGSVTGKGGHLIIIDDPVKNWEEASSEVYRQRNIDWMQSTMRTRAEPGAVIVVLQTRWHEADLAGQLQDKDDTYEVISLPALAEEDDPLGREVGEALCPERYNREELLDIKQDIGTKFFNALFQGRPSPEEGDIFKRHWWQFYDELPDGVGNWSQSWDFAFKDKKTSDYVVGGMLCSKDANIYMVDMVRDKLSFTNSVKAIQRLKAKYPQTGAIYVEDKANGSAIIDTLKDKVGGIIPINPMGSKEARAYASQPLVEAGNIWLPRPDKASWVEDFIEECAVFPNGKNDDQVDMLTQAIMKLRKKKNVSVSPVGINSSSDWLGV